MAKKPRPSAILRPADFALGAIVDAVRPRPAREFRVPVRRPDDLLVFDILVDNLTLRTGGRPRLERTDARAAAYLIIEFPPQSFGEEAFLQVSSHSEPNTSVEPPQEVTRDPAYPKKNLPQPGEAIPPLPSSRVRMAGRSRLAFLMPPSVPDLPFTLAGVLEAMRGWPLSLPLGALPDPDPPPHPVTARNPPMRINATARCFMNRLLSGPRGAPHGATSGGSATSSRRAPALRAAGAPAPRRASPTPPLCGCGSAGGR